MIILRNGQVDSLELALEESFGALLCQQFRADYPWQFASLPLPVLRTMVLHGEERARGHGFSAACDLAAFLHIMALSAPDFDRHPAVAAVLGDPAIPQEALIDELAERIDEEVWEELRDGADPDAWFPAGDPDAAMARLCRAYPEANQTLGYAGLTELFALAADKAVVLELPTPEALAPVAAAIWIYGEGFDRPPTAGGWVRHVRPGSGEGGGEGGGAPDLPPDVRLELLRLRLALDTGRDL